VAPLGEGGGCGETPDAAVVVARGNEPFWSVRVFSDRVAFAEPDDPDGLELPAVTSDTAGGRRTYRAAGAGAGTPAVKLVLEPRGCTDSMSGEYMHLTATVQVDGREMSGCGYVPSGAEPPSGG
jgi:uncharacterized membrane protein